MPMASPTFWLLDSLTGWRQGASEGIRRCPESGLRLRIDPTGPLGLTSSDGSLGRLSLPRGITIDACGALYLLGLERPWLRRFDRAAAGFIDLAPDLGTDDAPFAELGNLAAAGRDLYLADPCRRCLSVLDPDTLAIRHRWGVETFGETGQPADVVEHQGRIYLLERGSGAVWRHQPGSGELEQLFAHPEAADRWHRLAIDHDGRLYLLAVEKSPILEVFAPSGQCLATVEESDDVRSRFPSPPVVLDHRNRFRLPASLDKSTTAAVTFDREGRPATDELAEPPGPAAYLNAGVWHSQALDSEIHLCEWHRLDLELRSLPVGSTIEISTYSDQILRPVEEIRGMPDPLWSRDLVATGPMQPPAGQPAGDQAPVPDWRQPDALVLGRPGRYLWLRLRLSSDGHDTPRTRSLRIHYPRRTYLEDLPAVFSSDEASRAFLNRFLAIFHQEWDALDTRIARMSSSFDPRTVPAGDFLHYLADWLDQPLEAAWAPGEQRQLLAAAPWMLPRRGTARALRRLLRFYLAHSSGVEPADQLGFPRLIEGFRERNYLALGAGVATLNADPLWNRSHPVRAQLDRSARVGEARLVSTGEPRRDVFDQHAHRFRVFVPSAWVSTARAEHDLRRAVELEKPAQTRYDLCLVEPRLRIGVQATIGIDTVVGAVPRLQLGDDADVPPSRPPRHRLGYDSVLSAALPPALGPAPRLTAAANSTGGIP